MYSISIFAIDFRHHTSFQFLFIYSSSTYLAQLSLFSPVSEYYLTGPKILARVGSTVQGVPGDRHTEAQEQDWTKN
jgi:hypothetical protein